jgi:hypothetical protein
MSHLVRDGLRGLMLGAALRLSDRRVIRGFEVANLSESNESGRLFDRLEGVLSMMHGVAPGIVARMRQSFSRILIMPSGGASGSYWSFLDGCALGAQHLLKDSDASVAMTLVHEATHARLHRAGIRYRPALRARIEAICVRAEVDFGQRLPNAEHLVAEAESALATKWWEPAAQEHRLRGQLLSLRMPAWLRTRRWFSARR